jgi:Fe-S-cluster-containing dehydrogenase component
MPQKGWIFDISSCIGCHTCTVACKAENNNLEIQTSGSNISYRTVIETEGGTYPNVTRSFFSMPCYHCADPACLMSCPVGAITKGSDGIVVIDDDKCIGCRYCMSSCPYGAPRFDPKTKKVVKCSFCKHRLDAGFEPACLTSCVGGAISMVEDITPDYDDAPDDFAPGNLTNPSVEFKK